MEFLHTKIINIIINNILLFKIAASRNCGNYFSTTNSSLYMSHKRWFQRLKNYSMLQGKLERLSQAFSMIDEL